MEEKDRTTGSGTAENRSMDAQRKQAARSWLADYIRRIQAAAQSQQTGPDTEERNT